MTNKIYGIDLTAIIIVLVICILAFLVWNVLITLNLRTMIKKYKKLMRGSTANTLESTIFQNLEKIEKACTKVDSLEETLGEINRRIDNSIKKVAVVRFNAFSDTGSDLSYSIALLNDLNTGLILTGIYGRNESYTYAKPVSEGVSKYPLSSEEEEALKNAIAK